MAHYIVLLRCFVDKHVCPVIDEQQLVSNTTSFNIWMYFVFNLLAPVARLCFHLFYQFEIKRRWFDRECRDAKRATRRLERASASASRRAASAVAAPLDGTASGVTATAAIAKAAAAKALVPSTSA